MKTIRAAHAPAMWAVLGAIVVGCAGGNDASSGAVVPPAPTAVAPPAPTTPPAPPVATEAPKPAAPSMVDLYTKTLTTFTEGQTSRDAKKTASAYADDAEITMPGPVPAVAPQRVTVTGKDAITRAYEELYAGIANHRFGFSRVWSKNDVIVTEWISTFKHSGNLMGMKATDKLAGVTGVSIVWLTPEGLVKKEHRFFDTATIAGQVGLTKNPVRPVMVNVPAKWETIASKDGDDKNVDSLKAFYGALERRSEADFLGALVENPVHDDFGMPAAERGHDAAKSNFATFTKAFPDLKFAVDHAWGVGDYAIAEITATATHKGPFGPIPASNKPVKITNVDIAKLKDGKIHTMWSYDDMTDGFVQIGVVKPPPKPAAPAPPKPDAKTPAAPKK